MGNLNDPLSEYKKAFKAIATYIRSGNYCWMYGALWWTPSNYSLRWEDGKGWLYEVYSVTEIGTEVLNLYVPHPDDQKSLCIIKDGKAAFVERAV